MATCQPPVHLAKGRGEGSRSLLGLNFLFLFFFFLSALVLPPPPLTPLQINVGREVACSCQKEAGECDACGMGGRKKNQPLMRDEAKIISPGTPSGSFPPLFLLVLPFLFCVRFWFLFRNYLSTLLKDVHLVHLEVCFPPVDSLGQIFELCRWFLLPGFPSDSEFAGSRRGWFI